MAIEKITKEELLKELGEHILTDEEAEKVTGGASGETVFVQKESECVATIQPKATQMAGAGTIADR